MVADLFDFGLSNADILLFSAPGEADHPEQRVNMSGWLELFE
jgi:hypothetical protein